MEALWAGILPLDADGILHRDRREGVADAELWCRGRIAKNWCSRGLEMESGKGMDWWNQEREWTVEAFAEDGLVFLGLVWVEEPMRGGNGGGIIW